MTSLVGHKALLISVNRSVADASLYEATRYAWKINLPKAKLAEVILPTCQGLIVGAFIACRWLDATAENFPGREPVPGRFGFVGTVAPDAIRGLHVGNECRTSSTSRARRTPFGTPGTEHLGGDTSVRRCPLASTCGNRDCYSLGYSIAREWAS